MVGPAKQLRSRALPFCLLIGALFWAWILHLLMG